MSNVGLILELDEVTDQLDRRYLNALSLSPFTTSGVITDETAPDGVRWLAAKGTKRPLSFATAGETAAWLRRKVPRAADLASA